MYIYIYVYIAPNTPSKYTMSNQVVENGKRWLTFSYFAFIKVSSMSSCPCVFPEVMRERMMAVKRRTSSLWARSRFKKLGKGSQLKVFYF